MATVRSAIFHLRIVEVDDQRRIVHHPQGAALGGGHLRQHLEVVAVCRLEQTPLEVFADVWRHDRGDVRTGDPVVPDREVAHLRELRHPLAIRADGGGGGCGAVGRLMPVRAAGDDHAGGQALDVPLPRGRQRFVEVVDVEDLVALRCREGAEVRQVRVAAGLHGQPGRRGCRQILRHHDGGTAVEGERRDQHAPVADRDEIRFARPILLVEQIERVRPVGRRRPAGVGGAWHLLAQLPALVHALGDRRRRRSGH